MGRDAFRVNQDVIKRVEKQFAKKRADLAASNRNTKFSLPKEFEHLSEVKEFLQEYVFYNKSKPINSNTNNKQSTKQIMNKKIMNGGNDAVSKKKSDKDVKIKKKKKFLQKEK